LHRILEQIRLSAPVTVTWEVTGACNLRCRHCLSAAGTALEGELSPAEALRVVEILADAGVFQVNLGGGEPFLRSDTLDIMAAGIEHGMLMCASTNGLLMDRDLAQRLARLGSVAIQVSVDGARSATHEALRGTGSYAAALRAASYLAEEGVRTALNAVVTRRNLAELDALDELAGGLGVELRLSRLRPSGRADSLYDQLQLDPGGFAVLGLWLDDHPAVHTGDSFFFLRPESRAADALDMCGAARLTLSLDPRGDVYPCPFLGGPDFCMGNILRRPFSEVWARAPLAASVATDTCVCCVDRRCDRPCPGRTATVREAAFAGRPTL
jgi:mycofactocin radical SAM maturase